MENAPNQGREKEPAEIKAQVLETISEEDVDGILAIDKKIFPTMPVADEEIRGTLESDGVQVVLKDEESNLVGYVISLPHNEAYEFLNDIDPELASVEGGLYIESIGILPEHRSIKNLAALWDAFTSRAREKGYTKVTAHVRVSEGLSEVFQKRLKAVKHRTMENWADFNEPFDYLEFDLAGNTKEQP